MPKAMYVMNLRNGKVHDLSHLSERCNTDAIPQTMRHRATALDLLTENERFKSFCGWCMKGHSLSA